jgi:hypothetical protein
MDRFFLVIVLIVGLFVGYLIGYSIPPFIEAGVFTGRQEKGVKVMIDEKVKKYYEKLYEEEE